MQRRNQLRLSGETSLPDASNPEYEKERDRYREAVAERRARNERLGIEEVPSPPVWVYLEVLLHDGTVLKYVIRPNDFSFESRRLIIEPSTKGGWAERISAGSIQRYRFREFTDEAAARAAALSFPPESTAPAANGSTGVPTS